MLHSELLILDNVYMLLISYISLKSLGSLDIPFTNNCFSYKLSSIAAATKVMNQPAITLRSSKTIASFRKQIFA